MPTVVAHGGEGVRALDEAAAVFDDVADEHALGRDVGDEPTAVAPVGHANARVGDLRLGQGAQVVHGIGLLVDDALDIYGEVLIGQVGVIHVRGAV